MTDLHSVTHPSRGSHHGGGRFLSTLRSYQGAASEWPHICTIAFNSGLVTETGFLFPALRQDSWIKATALTWAAWMVGVSVVTTTPQGEEKSRQYNQKWEYLLCGSGKISCYDASHWLCAYQCIARSRRSSCGQAIVGKRSVEIVQDWL